MNSASQTIPFKSYDEAISEMHRLLWERACDRFVFYAGVVSDKDVMMNILRQQERQFIKRSDRWIAQLRKLPAPWPVEKINRLFGKNIVKETNSNPKSDMSEETALFGGWALLNDGPARRRLSRYLVETMGVSPLQYFPELKVTLLGQSAYGLKPDVLSIMLRHCSPPGSRLLVKSEHVNKQDGVFVDSTLLHRVVHRFKKIPPDSPSFENLQKVVSLLIKHDPECLLERNKLGMLPDELAYGGALFDMLYQARQKLQASVRKNELVSILGDTRSLRKKQEKPCF